MDAPDLVDRCKITFSVSSVNSAGVEEDKIFSISSIKELSEKELNNLTKYLKVVLNSIDEFFVEE